MYVHWQGMSIVETRRADKATRNAGDSVAKCQERTAAVCDFGLQTVQDIQQLKVKVKVSLCLTKHHAMKTYWGVEV
jgi:hypothetical protein